MQKSRVAMALSVGALLLLTGCQKTPCDRSAELDFQKKKGSCSGDFSQKVLGENCPANLAHCNAEDQKKLDSVLQCLSDLPVCQSEKGDEFFNAFAACGTPDLSAECRNAFLGGAAPEDGGMDAGEDTRRKPDLDGGGAVELVAVADENNIALAWSATQYGQVAQWEINSENAGVRLPEQFVPGSVTVSFEADAGTGVTKSFFIAGLNKNNGLAYSEAEPDVSNPGEVDAGNWVRCSSHLECPAHETCSLGFCAELECNAQSSCPSGFGCYKQRCVRMFNADGGVLDAGIHETSQSGRPFVSQKIAVTTQRPVFSKEKIVSAIQGKNPDMVAFDSARQFIALEQLGSITGYYTNNRGRTFVYSPIDTTVSAQGQVKLAYEPKRQVLYAGYNVGDKIRVRASKDHGRTWAGAVDVESRDADAGLVVGDFDIAPWKNGSALIAAVEGNDIVMHHVTDRLDVGVLDVVFASDGGLLGPQRPALATAPETTEAVVAFTAHRAGVVDSDVYGIYRKEAVYTAPLIMSATKGDSQGTPWNQDSVTVAYDSVGKHFVGAFVSREPLSSGASATPNVYASMLMEQPSIQWACSSDMHVFAEDKHQPPVEPPTFPERIPGSRWIAWSPSLVVTPTGKILLAFAAGPHSSGGEQSPDSSSVYVLGFDWNKLSPLSNGRGWFLPPAQKVKADLNMAYIGAPNYAGPVLAADNQLSIYTVFIEGVGEGFRTLNRPVFTSRP